VDIIPDSFMLGYNVMFTAYPVCWFAVLDFELTKKKLLSDKTLYENG